MSYAREKPCRDEIYKSRKNLKDIPSFSSTLLDEIYRSIDRNVEKSEDSIACREKTWKRHEEIASFRRACLVEKWMEKEAKDQKGVAKRKPSLLQDFESKSLQDNDLMFFSSTSSSSDSSGALSSSDTEFFGSSTTKPKVSCFSTRPKPVRTGVRNQTEDHFLFDDYKNNANNKVEDRDLMIKSKSRALKIYANLKKVKQPISPGGRLTSFINSLFSNANGKKSKNLETNKKGFQDLKSQNVPSTCSSASSFSRSCLSKYSPRSREKMRNGAQRTVRFHPVSVIVDEDSRPCGQKRIYDEDSEKYLIPPSMPSITASTELKLSKMERSRKVEEAKQSALKGYNEKRVNEFSVFGKIHDQEQEDDNDDEDDCMSDSSSDLFELDHLSLFGDNRFCQELPVYETTHFDTNRAIASGLIR